VVRSATFSSDLRSPPGRSFQTGEPVVIEDTADAPGFVISDLLKEHGIVSLANVPILIDGAAWGVLEVNSSCPRDFGEDTVEFLTAAAAIIGPTVQRRTADRSEVEAAAAGPGPGARSAPARDAAPGEEQLSDHPRLHLDPETALESAEAHRVLDHVANRINAISLAHDQLSPRQDVHVVDVASYLRALCASIEQQVENVAIEVDADEIELAIDRAVPSGSSSTRR
jgi:signal transduction protein with GAF and PtsI domain